MKNKMYWNYRIFQEEDNTYSIRETYYTNGKMENWTENPIIIGDTIKELYEVLEMIKKDMDRFPNPFVERVELQKRCKHKNRTGSTDSPVIKCVDCKKILSL